jgi:hypothetical protein
MPVVIPAACFELVDGLIVYFSNAIGTEQEFRPTAICSGA